MLKLVLIGLSFIVCGFVHGQDFSNKGREFWIAYGNHVRMFETITAQNAAQKMQLYMTSDVSTTGTVDIPGTGFSQSFTVSANQITTVDIPNAAALLDEGIFSLGIHVTALKPIVVYSFIYINAISGATVCLPVATLGRNYYSMNYQQVSNSPNSYSYFDVIATDTGITSVEIIPAAPTKGGHPAGVPYIVNLTRGQVYQALGQLTSTNNPFKGVDLTGSQIRSISTNTTSCKKIAVFCGSGKIAIGCSRAGTSDNLYQQMYPVSTWGKTYITVPSISRNSTESQYNIFRIFKSDPSAVVTMNGGVLPAAAFVAGQYYEFNTNQPAIIESDKPILVAQYLTTSGCNGNTGQGDPDMIYLNPVEQTLSDVTLNSMQPAANTNIDEHHLNVVLRNIPEVTGSFKVDGVSPGTFKPLAANANYAYVQLTVSKGTHTLTCDSGFNAIAYGFGSAESYGYSAGTNLKDLYQFVSIKNQYATVNFPAGCKSSPFRFSMTFPYKPVSIKWLFKGLFADTTVKAPVYDSSWTVNDKTLYRYTLNRAYQINTVGTYPITLVADNPTSDGCSGEQEIEYDLQIFERPDVTFSLNHTGCLNDPISFKDSTNGNGRPVIRYAWDFGDATNFVGKNPTHIYKTPGTYTVSFSSITDIGCVSDTVVKTLALTEQPVAKFKVEGTACVKRVVKFTDLSTPTNNQLAKWSWNFGDSSAASSIQNPVHTFAVAGKYTIRLTVESASGCKSSVSVPLTVGNLPEPDFSLPAICLDDPTANFFDSTRIADNTGNQLTYLWNFGDQQATAALNSATDKDPSHKFTAVGNYTVNLQVTSKDGCVADTTKWFTVNGSVPKAAFDIITTGLCSNLPVQIKDRSTVDFGRITRLEIYWDYANDPTAKTVKDFPAAGTTYSHKYPEFGSPATKTYQILYIVSSGISCIHQETKQLVLLASPVMTFDSIAPVCQELNVLQVKAGRDVDGQAGTGFFTGRGITATGLFSPRTGGVGVNTLLYQFTGSNGCTTTGTQYVRVLPTPLANAGPDINMLEGNSQVVAATGLIPATYLWTPATYMADVHVLTPLISPVNDITYRLSVTSAAGCIGTDDVSVKILKSIKVPNAFSPNGDGINDSWHLENLASYPGATVDVFNRYGQLVYHAENYTREWKGDANGKALPMGTYYWIINPKNGRMQMNGSVTLMR